MDFVLLVALILEIVILSGTESRSIGTRITPFGVLAFPYAAVVLLAFFLAPFLEFVPLNTRSLTIWMGGLFLMWLAGYLFTRTLLGTHFFHNLSVKLRSQFPGETPSARVAGRLAMLAIPMLMLGIFLSVRAVGGWSNITSPEFRATQGHGLPAHAILLCEPLFILLVGTAKKESKFQIVLAGILMAFFLVGQVKGRVLQTLMGGFLYRVMRGRSLVSAKNISILLTCGLLVFVSIYLTAMWMVNPEVASDSNTYVVIGRHFCYYLMAGVLGLSEVTQAGTTDVGDGSSADIFRPFIDVYRKLVSGSNAVGLGSTHEKGMQIDLTEESFDANTNVYTLFGTLYLYLGVLGSFAYVAIMAILCYALFLAAGWTRNEWLLVLYCYIAAQLVFGFFEFYFWHGDTYEIAVYTSVLAAFSSSLRRRFQPFSSADTSYAT